MSDGELSRLEVLRDLDRKRLTTQAAAQLLGLERRQVFRLSKAYGTEGTTDLISRHRGRSSRVAEGARRRTSQPGRRTHMPTVAPLCASDELHDLDQKPIDDGGQR